jgi:MFS family permease
MAPALLSMLTLGFPSGRDRNIAMSAYTVVSATGAAIGFVLGGILTEYLSWRWCLLINVPVSVLVLLGGSLLRESRSAGSQRYDLPGAVSATLGLLGVIYGISDAATHGWGGARTLAPIAAGIAILAAFVVWESRAPNPLLPLALLRSRSRVGGILAICCVFGPPAGLLLLTIVFLQGPQRESPLVAGLSFLPGPVCGALGAALVLPLIGRLAPRVLLLGVVAVQVVASIMLVRIHPGEAYLTDLLPALVLLGMGTASQYLIGNTIALADTPPDDAGVLGATINTFQQVSTALGASILATVAASVESHYLAAHGPRSLPQAVTHGDHRAFIVGAVMTAVLGIGGMLLMPGRGRAPAEAPAPGPVRPAPVSATPAATPRLIAWAITLGVVLAIAARGQRPP